MYTVVNTLLYTVLYTSLYFVRFTVLDDILYTNNKVTGRSDLIPKKHFFLASSTFATEHTNVH